MNTEIFEQFEEFDELKEIRLEKMVTKLLKIKLLFQIDVQFSEQALRTNFELLLKVLKNHRLSLSTLQKGLEGLQKSSPKNNNNDNNNNNNNNNNNDPSQEQYDELKKQVDQNTDQIEKLDQENTELKQEIKDLKDRLKNVEDNSQKPQKPIEQTTTIIQQQLQPSDPAIIDQLKANDENQMTEINQLKNQMTEEKERVNEQLQNVVIKMNEKEDKMNERLDALQAEFNQLKQTIDDLLEKQRMMEEFRNQQQESDDPNSGVSNDVIIDLKFQINKLGKQLNEMSERLGDFIIRQEFNNTVKNIEQKINDYETDQEEKHNTINQELEDLRNSLKQYVPYNDFQETTDSLQKNFQQQLDNLKHSHLPEKLSEHQSIIDNNTDEITNAKSSIIQLFNLFNQINSGMQLLNDKGSEKQQVVPVVQAAPQVDHLPKIQALENKIRTLENSIHNIQSQQSQYLDNYQNYTEKNDNLIQKLSKTKLDKSEYHPQVLADQIQALRDKINTIYNQYQQTDLQVKQNEEDIGNIFSKLSQKNSKIKEITEQREPQQGIDEEKIMILIKKQSDIVSKDLLKMIQELDKKIQERALKSELDEIAKVLRDLMDQIKKLADKASTKKGLIVLEKKINELYQIVMGDEKDKNLDGLLVKRPLGWACCSCDKELNNYQGVMGEHINWAIFPPKETSPMRMGKYAMHYSEINKQKSPQQSMTKTTMLDPENNQSSSLFSPPSIQTNDQFYSKPMMDHHIQPQTVKQGYSMYTLRPVFHPKSKAYKIIKNNQFKLDQDVDMKIQGKKTNEEN